MEKENEIYLIAFLCLIGYLIAMAILIWDTTYEQKTKTKRKRHKL